MILLILAEPRLNLSSPKFSDSTDSRSWITSYRGQQHWADLCKLPPFRVSKRLVLKCMHRLRILIDLFRITKKTDTSFAKGNI